MGEFFAGEAIRWCPSSKERSIEIKESWIGMLQDEDLDTPTDFCDIKIKNKLDDLRERLYKYPKDAVDKAKKNSNLYEKIKSGIFLNRSAMKLANIDSIFNRMFTDPRDSENKSIVSDDEPFYFADICAGSGGFTEYILWKKDWKVKGFGFTLRSEDDFNLKKFSASSPEMFDIYYGFYNDGNIYKTENINSLREYIDECTDRRRVHIVTADGGFHSDLENTPVEVINKRLYLCQFLTALSVLRKGGNFLCKLFKTLTHFSIGLIYLMYIAFDKISIHKPLTSRPTSAEKYIVCNGLRESIESIQNYMNYINILEAQYESTSKSIKSIITIDIIKSDKQFCNYIFEINNTTMEYQIKGIEIALMFAGGCVYYRRQEGCS